MKATPMANVIMPPMRVYRRARLWTTFDKLFAPIERKDGSLIWEAMGSPKTG